MTNDEKLLEAVLTEPCFAEFAEISRNETQSLGTAIESENPYVSTVGYLIFHVSNGDKKSEIYTKLVKHLNKVL